MAVGASLPGIFLTLNVPRGLTRSCSPTSRSVPGIVAGGLLAFSPSIDDLIITSFVAGQSVTFPIWVYGAVKTGIPPQVFVMGTLIFAGGLIIAVTNSLVSRRSPA